MAADFTICSDCKHSHYEDTENGPSIPDKCPEEGCDCSTFQWHD